MSSETQVIQLDAGSGLASLRQRLRDVSLGRVVVEIGWDARLLSRSLDFELLRREGLHRAMEIAIVSADPTRRGLAQRCGFAAFASVEQATASPAWRPLRKPSVEAPPVRWWEEPVPTRPPTPRRLSPRMESLRRGFRGTTLIAVLFALLTTGVLVVPTGKVVLVPQEEHFKTVVPVSVDPDAEAIDFGAMVVPSRKVGVEVEGYLSLPTTGTMDVAMGRAMGIVLFTNLLAQDYTVAAGTVLRTSSTNYPVRFRTTAEVAVPAGGQATVPIEALDDAGGNVAAFQVNRVEGAASSAVRVTNPEPTTGAEAEETSAVSQEDYDRLEQELSNQLLGVASADMEGLLEVNESLLHESLRIEAVPKRAFDRFVGEQAQTVGLTLRLLVSGQAVDIDDAEAVAYSQIKQRIPEGFAPVSAAFEIGEESEEVIGPGPYALFVSAEAYAAAELDRDLAVELVRGSVLTDASTALLTNLPLGQQPRLSVWPAFFGRMPILPLRITVELASGRTQVGDLAPFQGG